MKLTKAQCDRFKAKDKPYKKFDGGGLYLEIMPNGNKLWRLKYYFLGKEKRLSFGKYPIVTLLNAREKRVQAKALLNDGIDPSENRKSSTLIALENSKNTFEEIAREWHTKRLDEWSDKHTHTVIRRLESNIFPFIGSSPITAISPSLLLNVLRKIEARGSLESAKRTKQICGQVFRYGIQTGRCENNPTANLSGALATRKTKHFPTIDSSEIPKFLDTLGRNDARLYARTRRAILFSMLTFARPGEIRRCRWQDIDRIGAQWVIPAAFMKANREHIVPLSTQVMSLLKEQNMETGHINTPWVFPSQIRLLKPMSDGTVNHALKSLGYDKRMTAHGFRALARTTIREKLKYAPDIIEAQLAHKPSGPLGAAYDRAQFLDERRNMMQDWADFLDKSII